MAKKKEPCLADAVEQFKDVMRRASLTNYLYVNNVLLSKNSKDVSILIIPDQTLWNGILEDPEMKEAIRELNLNDPEENCLKDKFVYGDNVDSDDWIELSADTLYAGEMINITIDGFKYQIPVNKGLFPVRFKKAEFNNFSYKICTSPVLSLVIKKKFVGLIPDTSFTIIRAFRVI